MSSSETMMISRMSAQIVMIRSTANRSSGSRSHCCMSPGPRGSLCSGHAAPPARVHEAQALCALDCPHNIGDHERRVLRTCADPGLVSSGSAMRIGRAGASGSKAGELKSLRRRDTTESGSASRHIHRDEPPGSPTFAASAFFTCNANRGGAPLPRLPRGRDRPAVSRPRGPAPDHRVVTGSASIRAACRRAVSACTVRPHCPVDPRRAQ